MKRIRGTAAVLCAAAVVFASAGPVFAADSIEIDRQTYGEAAEGTGSGGGTWKWDGADALALNGFQSEDPISAYGGGLDITLEGENASGEIHAEGSLTVTGEGSLEVTADPDAGIGIMAGGDLTVSGTDLSVTVSDENGGLTYENRTGLFAAGDVVIEDSDVDINVTGVVPGDGGTGIDAQNVTISGSDVDIEMTLPGPNGYGICDQRGIAAGGDNTALEGGTITIDDSAVKITTSPEGVAAIAYGMPTGTAGTITITDAQILDSDMAVRDMIVTGEYEAQIIAKKGSGPIVLPGGTNGESMEEIEAAYDAANPLMYTDGVTIAPGTASGGIHADTPAGLSRGGAPLTADTTQTAPWAALLAGGLLALAALAGLLRRHA